MNNKKPHSSVLTFDEIGPEDRLVSLTFDENGQIIDPTTNPPYFFVQTKNEQEHALVGREVDNAGNTGELTKRTAKQLHIPLKEEGPWDRQAVMRLALAKNVAKAHAEKRAHNIKQRGFNAVRINENVGLTPAMA